VEDLLHILSLEEAVLVVLERLITQDYHLLQVLHLQPVQVLAFQRQYQLQLAPDQILPCQAVLVTMETLLHFQL
tara:strand:- start:279 stop:500 length:222 start_codon:yes stop_codon:yes gene_type:complete